MGTCIKPVSVCLCLCVSVYVCVEISMALKYYVDILLLLYFILGFRLGLIPQIQSHHYKHYRHLYQYHRQTDTDTDTDRDRETFFGGSHRLDPRLLDLARGFGTNLRIYDAESSPTFSYPTYPTCFIL